MMLLARCIPIPKSISKRRSSSRPLARACASSSQSTANEPVEVVPYWPVAAEKSTEVLCRLHSDRRCWLEENSMGPLTQSMQQPDVQELSRKSSRSSHSGSYVTATTSGSRGSLQRASESRLSSVSTTSSVESDPSEQPELCSCNRPVENLYKSYTLHIRLLMYARDLLTSMQSSRDVRTSFHDDPVLLPAEYFNRSDREQIMSTKVGSGGRCYRDVVEEVLLDKRGHFSCMDILPLVQSTFNLRSEDILSIDLAKLQETFHKEYRVARRQVQAALKMQQFGEHSV